MSLKQDNLGEGKSKSNSSSPKYRYLADSVNLESIQWAESGISTLEKEFHSAKSLRKQERVIDTMKATVIRIDLEKENPNITDSRRQELLFMRKRFDKSIKGLSVTHDYDTSRKKDKHPQTKTPVDQLLTPGHTDALRDTIKNDFSSEGSVERAKKALSILEDPREYKSHKEQLEEERKAIITNTDKYFETIDKQKELEERLTKALGHSSIYDIESVDELAKEYRDKHEKYRATVEETRKEMSMHELKAQTLLGDLTADRVYIGIHDHYVNHFRDISNERYKKSGLKKDPISSYEYDNLASERKKELRIDRVSSIARSTSPKKIIAFSTDKKAFVKSPDGTWFSVSKKGITKPASDKTVEKNLPERKEIYLTTEDKISKEKREVLRFMIEFEATSDIFTYPVPDKYELESYSQSKPVAGATGKMYLDSAKAVGYILNKPSDKMVPSYGDLHVPTIKELQEMGRKNQEGETLSALRLVMGEGKNTYASSYDIDYLISTKRLMTDSEVRWGILGSNPANNKPLIATDPNTGRQMIIAPKVDKR